MDKESMTEKDFKEIEELTKEFKNLIKQTNEVWEKLKKKQVNATIKSADKKLELTLLHLNTDLL